MPPRSSGPPRQPTPPRRRCATRSRPRPAAVISPLPVGNPPPRRVIPWPSWSAQLWATKGEQAKVELRLAGGDSLVAESFVKGLSRGSYGVFGVKADDGNWTLTVVRWDTVERVVVKGLKDLPTF